MGAPCPPHWTFAARAAYFGDRMCAFCDHRNPPGAKFCNDCASPLQLKPCPECDAVNDQAATNCYKCAATYPVLFTTEATPVSSIGDPTLSWATPGDVAVAATRTEPQFAATGSRAGWRLLWVAIPTILIAGSHAANHMGAAPPDALQVLSQPISERGDNAAAVMMSPARVAIESTPMEPVRTAAVQASVPNTNVEAPKRASMRQAMEKPLDCPFCTSDDLNVTEVEQDFRMLALFCNECGAQGPLSLGNDRTHAIHSSNQRQGA